MFAAVILGGSLILFLSRLIALVLIARGIDLERTWWDEILGTSAGALVLLYFGNDWFSILAFAVFALIPEVLARREARGREEREPQGRYDPVTALPVGMSQP